MDDITIIPCGEFDLSRLDAIPIQRRKSGAPGRKRKEQFLDILTAFDIETTNYRPERVGIMYVWQWCFDGIGVIMGRTWDEWLIFVNRLNKYLGKRECKLLCMVHNLAFEFGFIKGVWDFTNDDLFMVDSRKVVKCTLNHIEMRCSYMLTNMGLDAFTHKMGVKHGKLSGVKFDYNKLRFPWTPLTDYELQYCVNDVVGLVEAVNVQLKRDGDNFYTMPLTSTGYCRRDANKVMRKVSWNMLTDLKCTDTEFYEICREAFRGGNCHANMCMSNGVLENVHSWDRASSYPDVIINMRFPMKYFTKKVKPTLEDVEKAIARDKALILRIAVKGLRSREMFPTCPYLSYSKCRHVPEHGLELDNGRIVAADYLETTLTDIDFVIFLRQYCWDDVDGGLDILEMWQSRYGYLPEVYTDLVREYFRRKTALKGDDEQKLYYDLSKALLNSLYGLMAQDPGRKTVVYNLEETEEHPTRKVGIYADERSDMFKPLQQRLDEYNKRSYLPYVWGV